MLTVSELTRVNRQQRCVFVETLTMPNTCWLRLFTVKLSIIYINYIHGWDFQFGRQYTQCNAVFSGDEPCKYGVTIQRFGDILCLINWKFLSAR